MEAGRAALVTIRLSPGLRRSTRPTLEVGLACAGQVARSFVLRHAVRAVSCAAAGTGATRRTASAVEPQDQQGEVVGLLPGAHCRQNQVAQLVGGRVGRRALQHRT